MRYPSPVRRRLGVLVVAGLALFGPGLAGPVTARAATGTAAVDEAMKPILAEYLEIQTALAGDRTDGVQAAAAHVAKLAPRLDAGSVAGEGAEHYRTLSEEIAQAAGALADAPELAAMREAFKALSKPMARWATLSKPPGIDVVYCSMAKGSWLQEDGPVANPYYGASMLRCGEVVGGAEFAAGR